MKQQVNYILHLNEVVFKLSNEVDFNSTHISIYNALFHIWNNAGFEEQLSINRNEVMKLSKVGSVNTYIKCLKDLDNKKYIKYTPSHNPLKGSIVNLFTFDTTNDIVVSKYRTSSDTTTATLPKLLNKETIKLINDNYKLVNLHLKDWINSVGKEEISAEEKKLEFGSLGQDFISNWNEWVSFRIKIKKKFVDIDAQQKGVNQLISLSKGNKLNAQQIINKSIANSWQGLFALPPQETKETYVQKNVY